MCGPLEGLVKILLNNQSRFLTVGVVNAKALDFVAGTTDKYHGILNKILPKDIPYWPSSASLLCFPASHYLQVYVRYASTLYETIPPDCELIFTTLKHLDQRDEHSAHCKRARSDPIWIL
jgi:hypothetical protein